jgi:hypothetical protein
VGQQGQLETVQARHHLAQLEHRLAGLTGAQAADRHAVDATGGGVIDAGEQTAGELVHALGALTDRRVDTPPPLPPSAADSLPGSGVVGLSMN